MVVPSPFVYWAQTEKEVSLKIDLKNVVKPDVNVLESKIKFSADGIGAHGKTLYEFSLDLFSPVKSNESDSEYPTTVRIFDNRVEVILVKEKSSWWPRLTAQPQKPAWVKEKRDNQFKTGSGGGKKMKLDASDELILSIIGKESPVIHGLDSAESSGSNAQQPMELFSEETHGSTLPVPASPQPLQQAVVPTPIRRKFCTRNKGSLEVDAVSNEILQLKKKKVELEIGKLERENYKLDLQLLKLEKELNITRPSKFTLPLYLQDDAIIHINLVNGPSETLTDSTESNITSE